MKDPIKNFELFKEQLEKQGIELALEEENGN